MAEQTNSHTLETLREELSGLKSQLEKILKNAENKKSDLKEDLLDRLTKELEHLRKNAGDHAHKIYEHGQEGAEAVTEHVRRNPLASVLIAFGAGYVLSCIFRHMR